MTSDRFDVEHPAPDEMARINRGPSLLDRNGFAIGFAIIVIGLAAVLAYGTWHVSTLEPVDPAECAAARGAMFAEWQASYADAGGPDLPPEAAYDLWREQTWKRAGSGMFDSYLKPPMPPECRPSQQQQPRR